MNETKYETRMIQMIVVPEGDALYSERSTTITIVDEAAGEFVAITQPEGSGVKFDHDEWPTIRDAVDSMIEATRQNPEK